MLSSLGNIAIQCNSYLQRLSSEAQRSLSCAKLCWALLCFSALRLSSRSSFWMNSGRLRNNAADLTKWTNSKGKIEKKSPKSSKYIYLIVWYSKYISSNILLTHYISYYTSFVHSMLSFQGIFSQRLRPGGQLWEDLLWSAERKTKKNKE